MSTENNEVTSNLKEGESGLSNMVWKFVNYFLTYLHTQSSELYNLEMF